MKTFSILSDKDIFLRPLFNSSTNWAQRKTVKIILLNEKNEIALITNPIHKFFLLPGGGIKENEEILDAANRECQEEVGYKIGSIKILGRILEERNKSSIRNEVIAVVSYRTEEIVEDLRTASEKANGLCAAWFSLASAREIFLNQMKRLKSEDIPFYNTSFNICRDSIFFNEFLTSVENAEI